NLVHVTRVTNHLSPSPPEYELLQAVARRVSSTSSYCSRDEVLPAVVRRKGGVDPGAVAGQESAERSVSAAARSRVARSVDAAEDGDPCARPQAGVTTRSPSAEASRPTRCQDSINRSRADRQSPAPEVGTAP